MSVLNNPADRGLVLRYSNWSIVSFCSGTSAGVDWQWQTGESVGIHMFFFPVGMKWNSNGQTRSMSTTEFGMMPFVGWHSVCSIDPVMLCGQTLPQNVV